MSSCCYVPDLARALEENEDARVRAMAAWALGRIGGPDARAHLEKAKGQCDGVVREEVLTALRFPENHRKRIRTTNLLERLFGEGKRRAKVVPRYAACGITRVMPHARLCRMESRSPCICSGV